MLRLGLVLAALVVPLTAGAAAAPWCAGAGLEFPWVGAGACVGTFSTGHALECFRQGVLLFDQVACAASEPSCHAELEGLRCTALGSTVALWL